MISSSSSSNHLLQSHFLPSTTREFHSWRRRRLKLNNKLIVSCNLLQSLISLNSVELLAPVLGFGFASGAALYFSRSNAKPKPNNQNRNQNVSEDFTGEWILFTSPTPFNRFCLLRCPSITFRGSELAEDLSEKLVKEDRHYVKLVSGRIRAQEGLDGDEESNLVYQRTCVTTGDGGVISLDWPEKLDLRDEHGMDTTVLLVPGTPQGSMDRNVRGFVCELLRNGCFPVVMNPRGCAGSPLTTARLFTAGDSDDINTALKFINRTRSWNTMMAVGWGHGANMLTKYLAEVAENTPLTAAACIDNPFDLEEATRSFQYQVAVDQKLTSGLIDILQSNKELFQGRAKGFNVEKALAATSLRDFEREISMVSYGFESIEEFYSKSSTRELVGKVKIPLLFIQSDETVPLFSIPRTSVAENAFTNLLLCSSSPSSTLTSEKLVLPWCQHFAIEWLTAVELGLLKGRHPLLKDVDIAINPSVGLALAESRENGGASKVMNETEIDALNVDSIEYNTNDDVHIEAQRNLSEGEEPQQNENHEMLEQSGSNDAALVNETGENTADDERSQVLQSAQVVMNMLDVTMPGALGEEQKKKVLTAMEQGETLVKALEGVLPEEVRGTVTTAVSEIVKTKGKNLNLQRLMNISLVPNASSEVKSRIQETFEELPSATVNDVSSTEQQNLGDEVCSTGEKEPGTEKPCLEPESDFQSSNSLQQGQVDSGGTENNDSEKNQDQGEVSMQKDAKSPGYDESGPGTDSSLNTPSRTDDSVVDEQEEVIQGDNGTKMGSEEGNNIQMNKETNMDASDDQNKSNSNTETEENLSPGTSSADPPLMEQEFVHPRKCEENNIQSTEDQNKQVPSKYEEPAPSDVPTSNPSSFNVSQALDALTGFDDSTQVAVNSVFGVLENMIAKLEEENGQEINGEQEKSRDGNPSFASEESPVGSKTEGMPTNTEKHRSELSLESDHLEHRHPMKNPADMSDDLHKDAHNDRDGEKPNQRHTSSLDKNSRSSTWSSLSNNVNKEKVNTMNDMIDFQFSPETSDKIGGIYKVPLCVTVNPYGDSMYNEYLRRYLLSKIPNTKSLDLDSTADLLLDYFPEEGQWKLLEQTENLGDSNSGIGASKTIEGRVGLLHSPSCNSDANEIIETSYVILDGGKEQQPIEEYKKEDDLNRGPEEEELRSELICSVKLIILETLKVEVGRKLGISDMEEMESSLALDLEHVAEVVSLAVEHRKELSESSENGYNIGEVGPLHGEDIVQKISTTVSDSIYLKRVLPVGVVVGSILAALKKYFSEATENSTGYKGGISLDHANNVEKKMIGQASDIGNRRKLVPKKHQYSENDSSIKAIEKPEAVNNNALMAGAVTAAFGASALFASHQSKDPYSSDESVDISPGSIGGNETPGREHANILDVEKGQHPNVNSLAEKAMSVAGPVVPTKSDGGLDQERLVAMLSDLGQRGGMLRMVGKLALLWGGIRGAMSLTDRLISFLHIADRPLSQRLLGFACMVIVLWSPVVIPLFPTLVRGWAAHNSSGIAEYACVIGLYTAVTILIILWGKRIRGYEDPLAQYGFDLTSKEKILDFLKGLTGGLVFVLSIHSINALLGCAYFSGISGLPTSSLHAIAFLKSFGKLLILVARGFVTATVVVIVEEMLFRSWLPHEIAVDFGFHRAIIISGFAFSILQRSLRSIPGLWLLSIALSGLKQRSGGSLSIPIGMRTGILSSNFIIQQCGFVIYHSSYPVWLAGSHPLVPFDGAVGLAFCIMLAMLLYPKQALGTKKMQRPIRG